MERYDKSLFRRIVFIYMIQLLVLSVTGIVDSAVVGRFIGAEGLAGMKLAMPIFSLQYMFGGIFSTGLTVQVSKLLVKGRRGSANQCFLGRQGTVLRLPLLRSVFTLFPACPDKEPAGISSEVPPGSYSLSSAVHCAHDILPCFQR